MKLSELTTKKAADILLVIAPEVQPILTDSNLMSELRKGTPERDKALEVGINKIVNLIPAILGRYRQNVFRIIGALNDKKPDEIAEQNIFDTITQLRELFQDEDLISFFSPSKPTGRSK